MNAVMIITTAVYYELPDAPSSAYGEASSPHEMLEIDAATAAAEPELFIGVGERVEITAKGYLL